MKKGQDIIRFGMHGKLGSSLVVMAESISELATLECIFGLDSIVVCFSCSLTRISVKSLTRFT